REIKPNEHPLKHVPARVSKSRAQDLDDLDTDEPPATALYAFNQTSLYVPPPVVNGRIPKNAFGNLDIYVPSMVPPGGYHIRHALAKNAARLLGIDYADAVTGFQFKGRHGTAITSGVVVAEEYREAMEAVIEGFQYEQENEEARLYSLECLKLWRRFLAGLRIKERLSEYTTTGPKTAKTEIVKAKMDEAEEVEDDPTEAGGFFPDAGEITVPTAHRFNDAAESDHEYDIAEQAPRLRRQRKTMVESNPESEAQSEEEYIPSPRKPPVRRRRMLNVSPPASENGRYDPHIHEGGGFVPDNPGKSERPDDGFLPDADASELGGGFVPEGNDGTLPDVVDTAPTGDTGGGFVPEADDALESGGGFVPEVDEEFSGGGFLLDNDDSEAHLNVQPPSNEVKMDAEQQGGDSVLDKQEDDTFDPDEAEDTFDPDEMDVGTTALPREDSTGAHQQEEEDDHGSLLSHDPEDDDAEPDWLHSD
ncbi:Rad4-domain-containing protein, partial [Aureobasidium melanogenum]